MKILMGSVAMVASLAGAHSYAEGADEHRVGTAPRTAMQTALEQDAAARAAVGGIELQFGPRSIVLPAIRPTIGSTTHTHRY